MKRRGRKREGPPPPFSNSWNRPWKGMLNTREWKMQEWKKREQIPVAEKAGATTHASCKPPEERNL